uniref:BED-type domain-containing protein n=1 Tax=Amphimedon queenslandica TaxID=400682 RepID=A0A1X7UUK8_AMPQE
MAAGRPRSSCVWTYFKYMKEEDKSVCLVELDSGSHCGLSFKWKFLTNLKGHLKSKHPEQFKDLEENELQKNENKENKRQKSSKAVSKTYTTSQRSLEDTIEGGRKYSVSSERHKAITRQMAIFMGSNNVPLSLVENDEFKRLVSILDSRYEVPGRTKMGKDVSCVMSKLKEILFSLLEKARLKNICTDIWTKRGMTSSYLGVTVHFFSTKNHKRHNVTLAARHFPSPHTASQNADLVQEILVEYSKAAKVVAAILFGGESYLVSNATALLMKYTTEQNSQGSYTDNGSNMVAAFKTQAESGKEVREQERDGNEDDASSFDMDDLSEADDENETKGTGENSEKKESDSIHHDLGNFEECEDSHNFAFFGFKRSSCFAHTLQLVVGVFDTLQSSKAVIKRAHKLVAKVNK